MRQTLRIRRFIASSCSLSLSLISSSQFQPRVDSWVKPYVSLKSLSYDWKCECFVRFDVKRRLLPVIVPQSVRWVLRLSNYSQPTAGLGAVTIASLLRWFPAHLTQWLLDELPLDVFDVRLLPPYLKCDTYRCFLFYVLYDAFPHQRTANCFYKIVFHNTKPQCLSSHLLLNVVEQPSSPSVIYDIR